MPVFYYSKVQQYFSFTVGKSSEALGLPPESRATLRFYYVEVEQCLDFTVEEQCNASLTVQQWGSARFSLLKNP